MMNGYIGMTEAARVAGLDVRTLRETLRVAHRKKGGVLFKFSQARNAKLWTTAPALKATFPERFDGEIPNLDIIEIRMLVTELERRQGRLEESQRRLAQAYGRVKSGRK